MAGGIVETDKAKLAENCRSFMKGTKRFYDGGPTEGDMWFFELYHHLEDCADALTAPATPTSINAPKA